MGSDYLRVRFGYVAMSVQLENCSPSKTITLKNLEKLDSSADRINRLRRITAENLQNCVRLLYHNDAHNIRVFRLTSKLVPLATHPVTECWDWPSDFARDFAKIGEISREKKMRISSHPDHFTLINSPKPEVLEASLKDLNYHEKVFMSMGLDEAKMVMHVGGLYRSKDSSVARFKQNFHSLPPGIKSRLLLENDDKSFSASDVLGICTEIGIPMVFDVHHHYCLNEGEKIVDILPRVFKTWNNNLPKVHFSSPKSPQNCRAHADNIEVDSFYEFLINARELNVDFDVMIEAKNKDLALFNLLNGLRQYKEITIVNGAEISI